jgi:glutamine synthetase
VRLHVDEQHLAQHEHVVAAADRVGAHEHRLEHAVRLVAGRLVGAGTVEAPDGYVLRTVEERGVRLIRLWFTDVLGNLKSFAISPAELENALRGRHEFDGSSIDGFSRIQESDVLARPDPTPSRCCRGATRRGRARMFCDIHNLDGSPRSRATRARCCAATSEAAHEQGFTFYVAPDIEFFYFATARPGRRRCRSTPGGFFDLTTTDVAGDLRKQTIRTLETMSIPVEYSFHEDAPSQHEIDLRHTDALTMADSVMTFRLVVKEVAPPAGRARHVHAQAARRRAGQRACTPTSRCSSGDDNAFYDADDDPYNLSPVAKRSWPACCATRPRSPRSPTRRSTATSGSCPASRRPCTSAGPATTAAA